jgi:hypothetical protein
MAEFDILHVVGNGIQALRFIHDLVGARENKFGVLVDELLDQPRACDSIDFDMFTRDPFHGGSP